MGETPGIAAAAFFDISGYAHASLFDGAGTCWAPLGKPLREYINARIAPGVAGTVSPAAHLVSDDIQIGEGTVVEAGAYICGPAIIGKNCQIRHGAYIRGDVLVGDGCVIGHTTEVKGSIFLNGAKAGHFAYVGDSILGNAVNLGAGTKLANFKLTANEVVLRVGDQRIPSGLRKFGAILGDGCQTGCNSVTSPGTLLGKASFVFPCVSVRAQLYPEKTRLRE